MKLGRLLERGARHSSAAIGRLIAVVASAGTALALAPPGHGQQPGFRSTVEVPQAWVEYAGALRSKAEIILRSEDAVAQRLQSAFGKLSEADADQPPLRVTVRVWIGPDGRVSRAAFRPLSEAVDADLEALLLRVTAGAPPDGMLQPVHLKLSLEPRK